MELLIIVEFAKTTGSKACAAQSGFGQLRKFFFREKTNYLLRDARTGCKFCVFTTEERNSNTVCFAGNEGVLTLVSFDPVGHNRWSKGTTVCSAHFCRDVGTKRAEITPDKRACVVLAKLI